MFRNSNPTDLTPNLGKGTYVLILHLKRNRKIRIGRRKGFSPSLFRAGYYAYVGSAFGPGGLESRIRRHLRKDKKSVWHIDYLRQVAEPVEVWIYSGEKRLEREWADALIRMEESQPVEGFGNTDDRGSRTHLCYFEERPKLKDLIKRSREFDLISLDSKHSSSTATGSENRQSAPESPLPQRT